MRKKLLTEQAILITLDCSPLKIFSELSFQEIILLSWEPVNNLFNKPIEVLKKRNRLMNINICIIQFTYKNIIMNFLQMPF